MGWGWLLVNIVMPIAIPPFGVLLLRMSIPPSAPGTVGANFNLMGLFKDGQLAWIAAGMCAAALYEFVETIVVYNTRQQSIPLVWFAVLIPLFLSIIGAMFVAASGAVYSTDYLATRPRSAKAWATHYRTFISSVIVTTASAITLVVIHFGMLPDNSYAR